MSWRNIGEILVSSGIDVASVYLVASLTKSAWLSYKSSSSQYDMIQGMREVPISDLRSIISEPSSSSFANDFVIIRGRVDVEPSGGPNAFISSYGIGERRAVLQKIRKVHLLEDGEKVGQSLFGKVPFFLVASPSIGRDSSSDRVRVDVDDSTHELPLSTVYVASSTTIEQLSGHSNIYREEILPIGTEITAVGSVSISEDGTLQIHSCKELPYLLSKRTKAEMLHALSGEKIWRACGAVLLASLTFGVCVYVYRRISRRSKHWKNHQSELQQLRDRAASENENFIVEDEVDNEEYTGMPSCVLCMTRKRTFVFLPCGHLLCCGRCTLDIHRSLNPKCPVCRGTILTTVKTFL